MVVGTAGHIDHGKSALVLALTGTDPDRLQEEKARGITIDLGFAHTTEGEAVLSFVDVPGHERFVRNMLAGVGGMDLVMLHVAADESVMPQTREHFDICRLLRVPTGLVVITKADLVDADTLDVVRLEVQELVAGSFLEGRPVLAVSARTGAGLPELRAELARLAAAAPVRDTGNLPRLPIDRVFTMRGFGTVLTGTLIAGRIGLDQELVLLPSGRPVRVRGLQVHGRACAEAVAGQRVAVNVSGVDAAAVTRGETLGAPGAAAITRRVDVEVELLSSAPALRHGGRVRFHQGTRELSARIALSGAGIQAGGRGFARLHLEQPAALVRGDRFILRASSPPVTIGGGRVLDPLPPRRGVRTAAGQSRFMALSQDPAAALGTMIHEAGLLGLPLAHLNARGGVPVNGHEPAIRQLLSAGAVRIGEALLDAASLRRVREQALAAVEQYHAAHPLDEGMPREELRERLFAHAAPGVFEHVLGALVHSGDLVARDRVARRGHSLALTDEEARTRDALVEAMDRGGLAPPDAAALAQRIGTRQEVVDRIATLLVRQQVLVRVGGVLFHEAALRRLKDEVRSLKLEQGARTIDVGTFKDRYQVSRKYAIPLLEFLDRERVTRRVGDARQIL